MIVYIISNTFKSVAFEIIADGVKNKGVYYILIQSEPNTPFTNYLSNKGIEYQTIISTSRLSLIRGFFKILFLLLKLKPCIVHTHLREANFLGLTAAWLSGVKNRIYTRHHSTFNIEYYPREVKWDKYLNKISTKIISISKNVTNVLLNEENVSASKVVEIPHGFYLDEYKIKSQDEIDNIKLKYNLDRNIYPIIGVVSRYLKLKGIEYIIEAFAEYKKRYPNAHLVLANAKGIDQVEVKNQLNAMLNQEDYTEILFENDVFGLYNLFDYFVHVPINNRVEAFGQVYIEALATAVPSVFTISGIANEFVEDEYNALVVQYKNSKAIYDALIKLSENAQLRARLKESGLKSIQRFSHLGYIENHLNLYNQLCHQKDKK